MLYPNLAETSAELSIRVDLTSLATQLLRGIELDELYIPYTNIGNHWYTWNSSTRYQSNCVETGVFLIR